MNVGIVGNYGNNNQGDESILEGIIMQLENTYSIQRCNIVVFTNSPDQTKKRYGVMTEPLFIHKKSDVLKFIHTLLHHRSIIKNLDFLIIGGGGILMDLYRNNPFVYGIYGLLVKWTKIPAFVYGAGAGPIRTRIGKFFIRLIGNAAQHVLVRDQASKALLESIGVKKPVNVIMDPAFYLKTPVKSRPDADVVHIAVTAVPYFSNIYWPKEDLRTYQAYIEGMARNLDSLQQIYPNAVIRFISTRYPEDQTAAEDILEHMEWKEGTFVYNRNLNHQEILSFLAEQDLVIGTRLHSLILALVAKRPVLAVSYHQKVYDVMASFGLERNTVDIDALQYKDHLFLNAVQEMKPLDESTLRDYESLVPEMKQTAVSGMEIIKEHLGTIGETQIKRH